MAPTIDVPRSALATVGATIVDPLLILYGTIADDGRPDLRGHVMILYELAP